MLVMMCMCVLVCMYVCMLEPCGIVWVCFHFPVLAVSCAYDTAVCGQLQAVDDLPPPLPV